MNGIGQGAASAPALLTAEAAAPHISWTGAIEALRRGHRLPRPQLGDLLLGPPNGLLLTRSAYVEGLGYAVKAETSFPANAARGLPSIQGAVMLYDGETGAVRAIIEGKLITGYKTAADSVLAASLLARPDSRSLLILGAGTVAATLAKAYRAAFPGIERIAIWARRPQQAHDLIARLSDVDAELVVSTDLATAAGQADIISSATMAREPLLRGDWIRPGTHVDLIGGFTPEMREADDALIAKARVFVDYRETTIDCVGDLTQPIAAGILSREDILGDLYDLVVAPTPLRRSPEEITLFKNGGGAHLDLMVADYVANAQR
ncbi:ornithine cyclodeaminase family protein [Novosphingobium terrae]|uniref:ornithine cyclodeaminase family protein n=1 Tax=Novosphingobium terrae TaxID=2726189 RepID=UPI00197EBC84|nr:hypothetical protein [Novosphingobium terrae]